MTYRTIESRLRSIIDTACDELEASLDRDPEEDLVQLPQPQDSEEHTLYVQLLYAGMGVKSVAASTRNLLRSLDRHRSLIAEGSKAEAFYLGVTEFAEQTLRRELAAFKEALASYRGAIEND